jgi:hypothetical protein
MKRVGRAGPICRRAFTRPYKPMVIGTYSFWITLPGFQKGTRAVIRAEGSGVQAGRKRQADLSKTAGAEAKAEA